MLVEEPEKGDCGAADYEEQELDVPVLVVGKLMNEDFGARDLDERASSETQYN